MSADWSCTVLVHNRNCWGKYRVSLISVTLLSLNLHLAYIRKTLLFIYVTPPPFRTLCVLHNVMSKTGFLNQQTLTGCIQTSSVKLKPYTILVIICILFLQDLTSNYKIQSESTKNGRLFQIFMRK